MLPKDIEAEVLCRCVSEKTWRKLRLEDFLRQYDEDVSSIDDLVIAIHDTDLPSLGVGIVYVLETGYAVFEQNGRYTLYETSQKAFENRYFSSWAAFTRGHWTDAVPTAPGIYATRDRDLGKMGFRKLEMVHGKLLDTTGGFVRKGLVTEFVGQFWSEATPKLRGSF